MLNVIWLGLFFPLIGFLFLLATSSVIGRRQAGWIACSTVFLSFVSFATLLYIYANNNMAPVNLTLFKWIPIDKIDADFMLHLDPLSLLMSLIITGVGFLIHVYSIGYMEHDEDFARYFACLNFFIFSMLLLVLAGHLLVLFVGWEGVGLASYLLIGFWYDRPAAARAATKAFVINRIGDFGFLVGLLLTFYTFGTGNIEEISTRAGLEFGVDAPVLKLLCLLFFIGAIGKSAQIPLHTWLPDAMEGPTPVSALIHAATMVTAGVYLIVRLHSVFMMAPTTLHLVGDIGGATALFAALCAVGQNDLKRVLAYSTVSQLGLMFLACGIGAFYAAMFHLTTHAFVKALLFLSAGNVVHMMHGTTDMEKMGGLKSKFPMTHWFFLIGVLALAGIPPLSAFFSKELILEQEYLAGYETLFLVALITSILTGFYLTRAFCLTFYGKSRLQDKIIQTVHEAPKVMTRPVAVLAFLSIFGGFLGSSFINTNLLEPFLAKMGITLPEEDLTWSSLLAPETLLAVVGGVLGIATSAYIYTRYADKLWDACLIFRRAFFIDEIYWRGIVLPLRGLSRLIDNKIEPKFFDGAIRAVAYATQGTAAKLQLIQSGQIRSYIAWMTLGSVFLIVYYVL